ncbi:MAG: outer membrane beta-barrel protein [Gammaproteobacteria bacterium]|nr:outer membrane beta-barrel protein [Gammaproteobacteria bacterium]
MTNSIAIFGSKLLNEEYFTTHQESTGMEIDFGEIAMTNAKKVSALLLATLASVSVLAGQNNFYCAVGLGQVVTESNEVYKGPSINLAAGYRFNRNYGVEAAYDQSTGGTSRDALWWRSDIWLISDDARPAQFDSIHVVSILGTAEWYLHPKISIYSKLGVARGTVDYKYQSSGSSSLPITRSLKEDNLVLQLGFSVPIRDDYDITFSVKHQYGANIFELGDRLDATTVGVGLRISL